MAVDFNDILSSLEKFSSSSASHRRISLFRNCIDSCRLIDMGFNSPRFTWTNKRDNDLVMERLDRFLCNPEWQQMFEEANVLHLPRTSSDHCPILLNSYPKPHSFGCRPFHLEAMWFSDPSFPTLVKDSWSLFPHNVSLALEDFTHRVSSWNKHHFENIFHKKKDSLPVSMASKKLKALTLLFLFLT